MISRLFPQSQEKPRHIDPAYIPHALAATRDSTDPIAEELGFRVALYLLNMDSYGGVEVQFHDALHSERSAKSETVMKDTWGFCFWE